ncbi:MAG: tetratricopeptide repeat protein, partial [Spirochaetales bacterium]|nr:tetratricopeptide repeat protein [Spirochaetales bacterium]
DQESLHVYERVVELNGSDAASVYNLAVLLEAAGRREEAMSRYDAVLALQPDDRQASYRKGLLLAAAGNAETAIPYIERFVAANGSSLEARCALATTYVAAGRYADALELYEALTADAPTNAAAWFELARLRLTVAEDAEAGLAALRSAVDAGFNDRVQAHELLEAEGLAAADEVREILKQAGLFDGADASEL